MIRRTIASIALVIALNGCITPSQFEIYQPDTRFTQLDKMTFESRNNRISTKSIAGGIHIDTSGVYINPMAVTDTSGKTLALGLRLTNMTDHNTSYGAPNSLGTPTAIHFNADGQLISLNFANGDKQFGDTIDYNPVAKWASMSVEETGTATLTKQQYEQIIRSKSLAVKIDGSTRSATYEPSDIAPSFIANLKSFYESKVK